MVMNSLVGSTLAKSSMLIDFHTYSYHTHIIDSTVEAINVAYTILKQETNINCNHNHNPNPCHKKSLVSL